MANEQEPPTRLVTYGVGRFGTAVARLALHKGWPVVAAFNRPGPKVGRDLGALLGLERELGVVVEDANRADFDANEADIAVVTVSDSLTTNLPAYRRLLGAGLNVICLGGEATYPAAVDERLAAEIDTIARSNGVTFTGASVWDAYRIWPVKTLVGSCTALRALRHTSLTLVDAFGPEATRGVGAGLDVDEYEQMHPRDAPSLYRVFMHLIVASLGYEVLGVEERREPVTSDTPVVSRSLDCEVVPGRCIGTRFVIDLATVEGMSAHAELEARLGPPGETEHMSWSVDGDPSSSLRLERQDSVHATAASVINRVPDVIAAPPGLVTVDQLGPMQFANPEGS